MPLPLDDNGNPLTRVYIPTGNLPLDNSAQGSPDGSADPNAIGVNASDVQMPTKDSIIDKLLGTNGVERYQLWPEKLIRDALSAPAQVMQPNPYKEGTEENLAFENMRQGAMPQAALNMSALAGTGGLAGVGAEAGTSLGAGPFLRPALKYEGKIYKAPVGGQHMDAIPKDLQPEFTRQAMSGEDISNFNFGFMNHKGHFLNREDALKYAIDEGLMSPHDAKYGALTSTLMADSSKEAAAIDATAKTEPFYSAVEKQVDQVNQPKMTGDQWLGTLANKPGVKNEELQYTGLQDFLKNKGNSPVTKAEMQEHLQNNKVELKEVDKGVSENAVKAADNELQKAIGNGAIINGEKLYPDEIISQLYNGDLHPKDLPTHLQDLGKNLVDNSEAYKVSHDPTKYHSYQLPGGENYREKLLTLPENSSVVNEMKANQKKLSDMSSILEPTPAQVTERETLRSRQNDLRSQIPDTYKSSHWDEPNILAHVRMNDRMVDGKKSLHLEEIQSDWHQQGRDKGYRPEQEKRMANLVKQRDALFEERNHLDPSNDRYKEIYKELPKIQTEINNIVSGDIGVPDAPFKKTWHELALKRMVREAVEKGYDRLSWTPGEAQAARYDLSKQIDKLAYNPKTGHLQGFKDGGMSLDNQVPKNKLADFVGKEAAEKLLNKPTKILGNGYHTLENADLKIGGEGMKDFYDQIIPKALEKITGEKVKSGDIPLSTKKPTDFKDFKDWEKAKKEGRSQPIHYIDITPALKEKAMKGFPLFSSTKFAPAMEAYSNTDKQ